MRSFVAVGAVMACVLTACLVGCGSSEPASTTQSITTSSTTTTTELPATWKQIASEGDTPSARCYQAMVYDSTLRKIVMFAGFDGESALSETWSYSAANNTWSDLLPEGEGQPTAARQMSGAYDPTSGLIVSFDGTSWGYVVAENTWKALSPKGDKLRPARVGACIVKDDSSGKVILFGGTDMIRSYDETWCYDPATNTWTELEPEGEVPPGRSDAGMAYDPINGEVILFGGVDSDFNFFDDTWSYDSAANTWTEQTTGEAPSARSGPGFAYDPHSREIVLFGGIDGELVCHSDTWTLDPATRTWTQVTPTGGGPTGRGRVMLVYSADIDKLVLFGGATIQSDETGAFGSLVYMDDLWTYGVHEDLSAGGTSSPESMRATLTTTTTISPESTSAPDGM